MTTDLTIYPDDGIQIASSTPYVPGAALEDGEWFSIQNASRQEYKVDLMTENYTTVDFSSLTRDEFDRVDFIFVEMGNLICFQNIAKSKLLYVKPQSSLTRRPDP